MGATEAEAKGKNEVVFPIGLPEQGYFDFVDAFVAANPGYTELSDRKLLDWATKSGVVNAQHQPLGTNDKPLLKFLDDRSVQKSMLLVASTLKRNYVVAELKANLVPSDRKTFLSNFRSTRFNKRAVVCVG